MSDPVDTDALRDLSAWLYKESQAGKSAFVREAADQIDGLRAHNAHMASEHSAVKANEEHVVGELQRLHAVIENAPHEPDCLTHWNAPGYDVKPCTCWKASAR